MPRLCSKKVCAFEVDYLCECLSLQTYWCQFHLGEHLKLSNRTHICDTIIAEPSHEINDSILDFLEKEKSKIEKLMEIILGSLSPNLYNSKISIEESLKKLDYNLKEIKALIKKIIRDLNIKKDFNIEQLNNSELYASRLCFRLDQLRTKQSKILKSSNPNGEKDFRRTCWLYENSSSDPSLNQAYHEYVETHDKLTSLYLIDKKDDERSNLFIFNTESECEEVKVLEIQKKLDKNVCITQLPNGELFYWDNSGKAFIIDANHILRRLPSWEAPGSASAIYFNRSVYIFGRTNFYINHIHPFRFDLVQNRWIQLSSTIDTYCNCFSSVIFNENILIAGKYSHILLYSVDINSFSDIPYDFEWWISKILIKGEKRLYLIQCQSGSIFESDVDDEYTWKWIARSIIDIHDINQVYCSYNKGGIYISIFPERNSNSREYFKFELDQKTLIEIAFYNEYISHKRSNSKHGDIKCYSQAFQFNSDDARAYIDKGHSFYDLGNLLEEIERLSKAIKLKPNDHEAYNKKGNALKKLGKNLEALECLNEAIKLNPCNIAACSNKAKILCEEGREAEALELYIEAIKEDPDSVVAYINKGYTLYKLSRYLEVIECCNDAIRADSKLFLAYLCKGKALFCLDRKSEAVECYNEAIKINPNWVDFYFYKGKILSELSRDFEVIECCSKANEIEPSDIRFYMLKGKALSQMSRNIEKIECYKEVIKNFDDDAKTCFRGALIECDLEAKIDAIKFYNKKIESDPLYEEAYIRKGYALYNLSRKIEAIQCYNKLFKIDPKNKIKYIKDILDLSNYYYKLFEAGVEKIKVGTMNEEDLHYLDWIIELIERYSESIEIKTHYAYAYVLKGCSLHISDKYLEEIECYNKAISINSNDANVYFAKDDAQNKLERKIKL